MTTQWTRRQILATAAAGTAWLAFPKSGRAAPTAKIDEVRVISKQPELYHGWPTLARRKVGQLVLVWSGGREAHVCPFGRVEMMTSNDEGKTWTWPRVLLDGAIDDRDAGVVETSKGSLLVTTFTSLAYEPGLAKAEGIKEGQPGSWTKERLQAWQAANNRLSAEDRKKQLGTWMLRSTDDGLTWSAPYRVPVNSPHGPNLLSSGKLLYAGKQLWENDKKNGVCVSEDDGQTWKWIADVPTRSGDKGQDYHELHAVETAKGKLIVHIRNHNKANERETLQCESDDGGKTWSEPHPIDVWGLPSHLLRMNDGALLMSYGHRRAPFGVQCRLSKDDGKTWSEPMVLSKDGIGGDLGYPSTVQFKDGSLLTVWYESMREPKGRAVLRQAAWRLS